MPDDRDAHWILRVRARPVYTFLACRPSTLDEQLTFRPPAAFHHTMTRPAIPPFERLYLAHRDEILRFLERRLGRPAAEDAFQETFLRALRGYPSLAHGDELRAWLYAIAGRVVVDAHRRRRPAEPLPEQEAAAAEAVGLLEGVDELTAGLPPRERAAVVLRYGLDLTYREIGALVGSSEEAARQAASAGVRRLRARTEEGAR
ncbi:MAG: RNA polymerase sigma factor [Thermoleophilia bacterium]